MKSTLQLLEKALKKHPAPYWHQHLNLSRNALHSAKQRGNLSPSIAFALAEEMGENPEQWALVAAVEGERDSACRRRMARRILGMASPALLAAVAGVAAAIQSAVCILC